MKGGIGRPVRQGQRLCRVPAKALQPDLHKGGGAHPAHVAHVGGAHPAGCLLLPGDAVQPLLPQQAVQQVLQGGDVYQFIHGLFGGGDLQPRASHQGRAPGHVPQALHHPVQVLPPGRPGIIQAGGPLGDAVGCSAALADDAVQPHVRPQLLAQGAHTGIKQLNGVQGVDPIPGRRRGVGRFSEIPDLHRRQRQRPVIKVGLLGQVGLQGAVHAVKGPLPAKQRL